MATKKNTSKSSSGARLNASGKTKRAAAAGAAVTAAVAARSIKKAGAKGLVVAILCLIIGAAAGFAAYFVVCKNDTFEIVGKDEITITLDDVYTDDGAKAIEFGKDISDKIQTESNLKLDSDGKPTELGTFYVKYSVDSIKYGRIFKVEKIRLISVVEVGEGGE